MMTGGGLGGLGGGAATTKTAIFSIYLKPLMFPLAARKLPPGETSVPRDELTPVSVESLAPGLM